MYQIELGMLALISPSSYRSGIDPIRSARPRSATIMNRLRFVRSIHAPITRPNNRYGRNVDTIPRARLTAEPVSLYTSSGSATWVKAVPRFETLCPAQNFQKSAVKDGAGAGASTALDCMLFSFSD